MVINFFLDWLAYQDYRISISYYLPIAGKKIGFIPFLKVLVLYEM